MSYSGKTRLEYEWEQHQKRIMRTCAEYTSAQERQRLEFTQKDMIFSSCAGRMETIRCPVAIRWSCDAWEFSPVYAQGEARDRLLGLSRSYTDNTSVPLYEVWYTQARSYVPLPVQGSEEEDRAWLIRKSWPALMDAMQMHEVTAGHLAYASDMAYKITRSYDNIPTVIQDGMILYLSVPEGEQPDFDHAYLMLCCPGEQDRFFYRCEGTLYQLPDIRKKIGNAEGYDIPSPMPPAIAMEKYRNRLSFDFEELRIANLPYRKGMLFKDCDFFYTPDCDF